MLKINLASAIDKKSNQMSKTHYAITIKTFLLILFSQKVNNIHHYGVIELNLKVFSGIVYELWIITPCLVADYDRNNHTAGGQRLYRLSKIYLSTFKNQNNFIMKMWPTKFVLYFAFLVCFS